MRRFTAPLHASTRALLLAGGLLVSADGVGADVSEAELRAAFVFNFTKYVDWPAHAFNAAADKLAVCLIGGSQAEKSAIWGLQDRQSQARTVQVRELGPDDDLTHCQVLVMAREPGVSYESVLPRVMDSPILTINGSPRFLELGGMIDLIEEGGKLRFDINLPAAQRAGLTLSSNLLRLARRVKQP